MVVKAHELLEKHVGSVERVVENDIPPIREFSQVFVQAPHILWNRHLVPLAERRELDLPDVSPSFANLFIANAALVDRTYPGLQ